MDTTPDRGGLEEADAAFSAPHVAGLRAAPPSLPVVLTGAGLALGGVLVALGAVIDGEAHGWLTGAGLIVFALVDWLGVHWTRREGRQLFPLALALVGVALVALTGEPERTVGSVLAVALVLLAVRAAVEAARADRGDRGWRVGVGLVLLVAAFAVVVWPTATLTIVGLLVGITGVAAGVLVLARADRSGIGAGASLVDDLTGWLQDRVYSEEDRRRLVDAVYIEGDAATRTARATRLSVLLVLAAVIASLGLVQDNSAVVIGAMLISPMMVPIMGLAAALTMGWSHRILGSIGNIVLGSLAVIAIALVLGAAFPSSIIEGNGQIASFSSPSLIDLAIALAAGAAGGFAYSRQDVANSLVGVAVSLSLVPSLATTGILLANGVGDLALGGLLTFATNAVAIVLAASVAFVLTGFAPMARMEVAARRVRLGFVVMLLLAVLLAIPLTEQIDQTFGQFSVQDEIESATEHWLGRDSNYEILDVTVTADGAELRLAGTGEDLPPVSELLSLVNEDRARDLELVVKLVPQQVLTP